MTKKLQEVILHHLGKNEAADKGRAMIELRGAGHGERQLYPAPPLNRGRLKIRFSVKDSIRVTQIRWFDSEKSRPIEVKSVGIDGPLRPGGLPVDLQRDDAVLLDIEAV